jgi:FtsP/CotA-like multicopper oxidase with cupredoxin domain
MRKDYCLLWRTALVCLLSVSALSQAPDEILANQNRVPAGKLENGVLSVQLELRSGAWHAEADDGPRLFVQAFGEARHAAQIPGPLLRMPGGTIVHATVTNKLKMKATVYGLSARPIHDSAGTELAAGESHEFTFLAGSPGTYYYWARTTEPLRTEIRTVVQPLRADAQMNGAFIVDPPGAGVPDRVFVMNSMFVPADPLHPGFEVLTINGKLYPYTEPLEYTQGERIRWRVINAGPAEHPMHLHGAFFDLLSVGDFESDTIYPNGERQSVVTENMLPGGTMMMEWRPAHAGRWLFHCHLQAHISTRERVPLFAWNDESPTPGMEPKHHDSMVPMHDMAGLVLMINVKAASPPVLPSAAAARKIDLVIERNVGDVTARTFSCSVREGKKIVVSQNKSLGPPIVLTRGEHAEITVINHLDAPTTIHWHGLELESYYDGVAGGGDDKQMTPAIQPGTSFVASFTPDRAGTFIYHTHTSDPSQLPGGIYGGLIVLEPGASFDTEHDRLLVIGAHDNDFYTSRFTLNGSGEFPPMVFRRGVKYRLRWINIAPNLRVDVQFGAPDHPAMWRPVAKDGADLPSRLLREQEARLHIVSGETYDFEFQPNTTGEFPFQVENSLNQAKVVGTFVVQ